MGTPLPWVLKARELVKTMTFADGKPRYRDIGKIVGQHAAQVQMRAGPRWPAYSVGDSGKAVLKSFGFNKKPTVDQAEAFLNLFPEALETLEMSDRQFTPVTILHNGVRRPALRIDCSKKTAADCLLHEEFSNKTGSSTSPVHAASVFRNHGWVVGGGPRADICPKCMAQILNERRDKRSSEGVATPVTIIPAVNPAPAVLKKEAEIAMNVAAPVKPAPITTVVIPARAENKPAIPVSQVTMKDLDKTAKRLIDGKLDEVYASSKGGYVGGYSDAKISTELSVPPEWVALVRDFGHGPNVTALDVSEDMKALDIKAGEVREAKRLVDAGVARMTELDKALNDRLAAFEKTFAEYNKMYVNLKTKVPAL